MGNESFILFAVPDLLSGAASIFDPSDSLSTYNESQTGADADALAAFADWVAVGKDLSIAVASVQPGADRVEKASAQ